MALAEIDRDTWRKTRFCDPGQGYALRTGAWPTRILVHTTNGNIGTTFEQEARFLATSRDVGAHYLVGKAGQVARLLTPMHYVVWHAGLCRWGWGNASTVGIEVHYTPGEGPWPTPMLDALGNLVLDLCAVYPVGDLRTEMRTHRWAALPPGRKIDPSGFSDYEFTRWREALQVRRVRLLEAA